MDVKVLYVWASFSLALSVVIPLFSSIVLTGVYHNKGKCFTLASAVIVGNNVYESEALLCDD